MLLNDGIALIPLNAQVLGKTETVYPVLLWDEQDAVLIDTGFPGCMEELQRGMSKHGVETVKRIILTHQDIDHIGNVEVLEHTGNPEFATSSLEKPYIEGQKRLLRFTDEAIASLDNMPDHIPASFKAGLKRLMLHPPRVNIGRILENGTTLPWCGGIDVIATPGHTPGHISLFHRPSGTLIAGDALIVEDGQLKGPDNATSLDLELAWNSLEALTSYSINAVLCYHGGLFTDRPSERIQELLAEHCGFKNIL
ncbi:Glyoxylase, beta-lactamase superfamily II [Paenibacillaceae bacterium GAS479]|nr:Glyoxylase, beta-lactamase superfamily II [Paenibacillaceae bacterium GAS479]